MPQPPTGTLAFLLTNVAGSAARWEAEREAMAFAMARHDEIVAEVVRAHGGVLLPERSEGDSAFCVFSSATDAVAGALELQEAMLAEAWSTSEALFVRVALHTCEASPPYRGPVAERARRLCAAAAPAQVLLSGPPRP